MRRTILQFLYCLCCWTATSNGVPVAESSETNETEHWRPGGATETKSDQMDQDGRGARLDRRRKETGPDYRRWFEAIPKARQVLDLFQTNWSSEHEDQSWFVVD